MVKLKFDEKKKEWIILPKYSSEGLYLNKKLKIKLNNIKKIQKKGFDCIFIIDGDRRTGKSILGMTCAWYLSDTQLTINNFAIGSDDASKKIKYLKDEDVLFIDEGSNVFNSKDAMRHELKQLMKIIDVVGQKRLIMIIVLPSFFDLIKPIAVRYSKFLLHVYTDNQMNRGKFAFFGVKRKKMLYIYGKKHYDSYSKPRSDFRGGFTNFQVSFYEEYLKLKEKTLLSILDVPSGLSAANERLFRRKTIKNNDENEKRLTNEQLALIFHVSPRTIRLDRAQITQEIG